jgi:hypothetical protein
LTSVREIREGIKVRRDSAKYQYTRVAKEGGWPFAKRGVPEKVRRRGIKVALADKRMWKRAQ